MLPGPWVLIDFNCFDEPLHAHPCPWAHLSAGTPAPAWAMPWGCWSPAHAQLWYSHVYAWPWTSLIWAQPCHHGLAWHPPDRICLLPLGLTLTCRLASPQTCLLITSLPDDPGSGLPPWAGPACVLGPASLVSLLAPGSSPSLAPAIQDLHCCTYSYIYI